MVVAGMPSDDARDYVDGLAQSAPPAQYFLTSIAGVDLPQVGQLSEIFQHPMYQLK